MLRFFDHRRQCQAIEATLHSQVGRIFFIAPHPGAQVFCSFLTISLHHQNPTNVDAIVCDWREKSKLLVANNNNNVCVTAISLFDCSPGTDRTNEINYTMARPIEP